MTVNLLQTGGMDPVTMLTARQEAALRGLHASQITRARKDPAHPAHYADGKFRDPRCDLVDGPSGLQIRAPQDAVEAFWDARRRGPKPRTPQEQQ